jgi:hypothetical protein
MAGPDKNDEIKKEKEKKVFIETRKPEARPQAAAKSELQLCDLGGT